MVDAIRRMCDEFWATPRVFGIGNAAPASVAASLIAGLFYAKIINRPGDKVYELMILCRLEVGPHLASLIKGLLEMGVRIYYEIDGHDYPSATFCEESTWDRCTKGQTFERRLDLTHVYSQSHVQVQVDSVAEREHRENLSNSPCKAGDIMEFDMSDDAEDWDSSSVDSGSCYGGYTPVLIQECPKVPVCWHQGVEIESEKASIKSNTSLGGGSLEQGR